MMKAMMLIISSLLMSMALLILLIPIGKQPLGFQASPASLVAPVTFRPLLIDSSKVFSDNGQVLKVVKEASPNPVQDGALLTYTLRVTNTGPITLTATITDTLPSQIIPTGVRIWTPTITASGGVWTEQFSVTVQPDYTGALINKVEVTTQEQLTGRASVTVCVNACKIYLPLVLKSCPTIYDFEGDVQGWGKHPKNGLPQPGEGVTSTMEVAYSGSYSLRFDDLGPYTSETTQDVGVKCNFYGKKVTAWVYLPPNAPSMPVVIYIQDMAFGWYQSDFVILERGWNKVFYDTRDAETEGAKAPYKTMGLHFTPGNYTGPVYIDYVVVE